MALYVITSGGFYQQTGDSEALPIKASLQQPALVEMGSGLARAGVYLVTAAATAYTEALAQLTGSTLGPVIDRRPGATTRWVDHPTREVFRNAEWD